MLIVSLFLIVFLGLAVVLLTAAICALCMGFYDEIYGDLEKESGD